MATTKLQRGKPLVRETGVLIDGSLLTLGITAGHIELWLKGNRDPAKRYELPLKRIYAMAVSLDLHPARRIGR